ncbi:MAG: DUF1016 family protein [Campylobacterales bacterium]|nr:DUF1016 family protein [Campylobacterales bacterium]
MSQDLKEEFGEKSGYSSSNLWRMRTFYLSYKDNEKLAQLVREISWGQNILIFEKCKSEDEKAYYIKNTIENGWNRNVLMHHIKTELFRRDKPEAKSNNFEAGKMNFYLNLLNDTVRMPHENPSIGILLCTDKDGLEAFNDESTRNTTSIQYVTKESFGNSRVKI